MKTLVIYYSYSGHTKKVAEELAKNESAEIFQIIEAKRPGIFKTFAVGTFAARRGKAWPIQPLGVDLNAYDRLFLLAPIWASFPAPYIYNVLENLPEGKVVCVILISSSGNSGCKERLESMIKAKGCTMESYEDIKA